MKRMMKSCAAAVLALALLMSTVILLSGCGELPSNDPAYSGVVIVCTNYAALELTGGILSEYQSNGGEGTVQLMVLGSEGQDMHSYEPSAKDIILLAGADVVVCTGAEGWLDSAVKASGNAELIRVSMMEACDTLEAEHDHDHDHGGESCSLIGQDEHVWLSVTNAIRITEAIEKAICRVDAPNASAWQASGTAFRQELTALRDDFAALAASAARNTVVIADRHPFAYLFRDMGITCVAAFPGCSSETSASFATQTTLIETVRGLALPYVFVMEGSDGKVASVVAAETGAGILTLDSMQVMKAMTDGAPTYVEIMRGNLENLKKALQ